SCVVTQRCLVRVWPCWAVWRRTLHCLVRCRSWQKWRISWSSCISNRPSAISSSSPSSWPTTSDCWGPLG
ncbi:hypothetical protein M9458_015342, partial [Cirrhinus mrigala]